MGVIKLDKRKPPICYRRLFTAAVWRSKPFVQRCKLHERCVLKVYLFVVFKFKVVFCRAVPANYHGVSVFVFGFVENVAAFLKNLTAKRTYEHRFFPLRMTYILNIIFYELSSRKFRAFCREQNIPRGCMQEDWLFQAAACLLNQAGIPQRQRRAPCL